MQPVTQACLWMIGAIVSFSLMAVAGREVSVTLDTFEIMMYRSFVGIILVVVIGGFAGTLKQVTGRKWRAHVVRNAAHFTGQNLWFYAITVLPLAQVFALEFTTPIWAILMAPLILRERITSTGLIAAAVGFVGVLIVARPNGDTDLSGLMSAASAAVAFALTALLTRKLTRTESITTILVYLTCTQAIFGIVLAGIDGDITLPDATSLPWVVAIGCAGLLAHFCLTKALSLAPASIVMPIDFARLPTIAVIGMWLYAEPLELAIFIGAGLIFAGNYFNIWTSRPRT